MLIDTHFHISRNDDIDCIYNDAIESGVSCLIVSSCDLDNILFMKEKISLYKNMFWTIGFHPSEADCNCDIKLLSDIAMNNNKVVAIGEIGLDYHYSNVDKDKQKELFIKQLDLAVLLDLPVVIHSRDAFLDTYNILKNYKLRGIIHCFSLSYECAMMYINLGYYLGIGGVVTFKNSNLAHILPSISLKHIVFETDSPYLAVDRGTKNSPKVVKDIALFVSKLYNVNMVELAEITTNNVVSLFDLNIYKC